MKKIYACAVALGILISVSYSQTVKTQFPVPNGLVKAMVRYGNAIYIGGEFTRIVYPSGDTYDREGLAALDANTGALLPWAPSVNRNVYGFANIQSLAAKNNIIYVAGIFNSVGGQQRMNIAAVDATSGLVTSWNPGVKGYIKSIFVTDTRVYVGGTLKIAGEPDNLIALDASSGQHISGFNPQIDDDVVTMALNGNSLFIGGRFTTVGTKARPYIGAINAFDGSLLAWHATATDFVHCLKIENHTLYVAGYSQPINHQGIAALDITTGAVLPWNPNVDGGVIDFDFSGRNIYMAGYFARVQGQERNELAMVDAASAALSPWNPNVKFGVNCIVTGDSTVFVGGYFDTIARMERHFFAALTSSESAPLITCPSNITVSNAPGLCSQTVTLNPTATGSNPIITYEINGNVASNPTYNFPVGTTIVKASASNNLGKSTCSFTVTVNDTEAPRILNLSTNTNELWPANKKMRDVSIDYTNSDNCTGPVTTQLSVTSNEPSAGNDWKIIDNHHIQLKADRLGNGPGRVYTITLTATDQHGNTSSRTTTVSVAHDQSKNSTVRNETITNFQGELLVSTHTNPSRNYFTLVTQSPNTTELINLRLYDIDGRLLEVKNAAAGQTIQMGKTLRAGFYLLQYSQGKSMKQISLVKQ